MTVQGEEATIHDMVQDIFKKLCRDGTLAFTLIHVQKLKYG